MAVTLQDHVHLSSTLSDVTTPAATSRWTIKKWAPTPWINLTLERTQTNVLKRYVSRDGAGAEVRLTDLRWQITVEPVGAETIKQRLDRLFAMHGQLVYVHDIYHDSAAHGSGYKTMVIQDIGEPELLDPAIQKMYVEIFMVDASI